MIERDITGAVCKCWAQWVWWSLVTVDNAWRTGKISRSKARRILGGQP